jgi:phosphoribosylaminoimidazole-succinocarboxamide synthase
MSDPVVLRTSVPGYPCRSGKVRDVYDLGDRLAVVTTDRVSAFDWVMSDGIPGKGRILTEMTRFWLDWLQIPNHLISDQLEDLPTAFREQAETFRGRTMLVRKAEVIPIECVARGYLAGSGWKEYRQSGTVCGIPLPAGLREASQLPEPIFTPATKAESGHDENINFQQMSAIVGVDVAQVLQYRTLDVYRRAADYAKQRGVIIADTKFEWGTLPNGEIILIDEVLTPDSSRFWPMSQYQPGGSPPSFDKQFLRDWLESTTWDKNSPPPQLPEEVIEQTAAKYHEALRLLKG